MRSILFISSLLAATPAAAQAAPIPILDINYSLPAQGKLAGPDNTTARQAESKPASKGDRISVEIKETIRSGRPFRKQGMNLTDNLTFETSVTVSGKGLGCLSLNVWHAETGRHDERETDLSAECGNIKLGGGFTATLQGGIYYLPGRNAVQGMVTVDHAISKRCGFGLSFEKIGGGFVDTTKSAQLGCEEVPFLGGQASGSVMVAHSSNTGRMTGSIDAGVDFELGKNLTLRPGVELFANTRAQHVTVQVGLSRKF